MRIGIWGWPVAIVLEMEKFRCRDLRASPGILTTRAMPRRCSLGDLFAGAPRHDGPPQLVAARRQAIAGQATLPGGIRRRDLIWQRSAIAAVGLADGAVARAARTPATI